MRYLLALLLLLPSLASASEPARESEYETTACEIIGEMYPFENTKALSDRHMRAIFNDVLAISQMPEKYDFVLCEFDRVPFLDVAAVLPLGHRDTMVVMIERDAFAFPEEMLRGVMAHELAHVYLGHNSRAPRALTSAEKLGIEIAADKRASKVVGVSVLKDALIFTKKMIADRYKGDEDATARAFDQIDRRIKALGSIKTAPR